MRIRFKPTNLLISVAIFCSFLGSGISFGTIAGVEVLPVRIIGIICFFALVVIVNIDRTYFLKVQYLIFSFFYMIVVTLFFSDNIENSMSIMLDYLCLFSIMCLILSTVCDEKEKKQHINLYLLFTVATIVICIYEYVTQHHIARNYTAYYLSTSWEYLYAVKAPTAFLYNPNNVTVLMLVALPLFIDKINNAKIKKHKIGWILATMLDLAVILMTGSRGGTFAGAVILIVYFFISTYSNKNNLLVLFVSAFVFFILFKSFFFKQLEYGGMIDNGTIRIFKEGDGGRIKIAQDAITKVFARNPLFGMGANSIENMKIMSAHNTIVEVMCNYGLFGLLLFIFLLINLLRRYLIQEDRTINLLVFLSFLMAMFIPPTIMTLPVLFIPLVLRATWINNVKEI